MAVILKKHLLSKYGTDVLLILLRVLIIRSSVNWCTHFLIWKRIPSFCNMLLIQIYSKYIVNSIDFIHKLHSLVSIITNHLEGIYRHFIYLIFTSFNNISNHIFVCFYLKIKISISKKTWIYVGTKWKYYLVSGLEPEDDCMLVETCLMLIYT